MHDEDDLDFESGRPLSQQIADQIEQRILNGDLPAHRSIPSETQLLQLYPVSRDTVRRAVNELRSRGRIYTVQGKGSYVRPAEERPDK